MFIMVDENEENTWSLDENSSDLKMDQSLCRLCLELTESKTTIFEKGKNESPSAEELLNDLFNIKYENVPLLPTMICYNCLYTINSFNRFRKHLLDCEAELKKIVKDITTKENGKRNEIFESDVNPEEVMNDDGYEIIEIDPNQPCSSTEDEFSNDSDAMVEIEELAEKQLIPPSMKESILSIGTNNRAIPEALGMRNDSAGIPKIKLKLEIPIKNTYLCQFCDMAFVTTEECIKHENLHDKNEPYTCSFCLWRFSNRPNLIFHIRENHETDRPFICALCKKQFCRRSDLKKHTTVHTGVRPFTCPFCSKCFSRNTNLTKHMRIHSGERPHVCQLCPRSFTTSAELIAHSRTHSESKPFRCSRCPASFVRKDKLLAHERTHAKKDIDKPLKSSSMPGYNLPADQHLNQHQSFLKSSNASSFKTPTNPVSSEASMQRSEIENNLPLVVPQIKGKDHYGKQFKCEICSTTYARELDFQRHQALHIDTLFKCKVCGTSFNRREKLMKHELEVHRVTFNCTICNIAFTTSEDLEMHKKSHESPYSTMPQTTTETGSTFQTQSYSQENVAAPFHQGPPQINLGFYSESRSDDLLEK